jgi:ectoine hydroxylase-related dioxygenase (phytanoyl-CoA dioxygenase family)
MIRPNPKPGQAMLFSPYLVHGGGYNLNTDTTRVSLEMRFWKK